MGHNWTCGYCDRPQVATDENFEAIRSLLKIGTPSGEGRITVRVALRCLNPDCAKITLSFALHRWNGNIGNGVGELLQSWRLMPGSTYVTQPDYIPEPIRTDYYEACSIKDLSPKASATLARRCLQGMIRDFAEIKEKTLFKAIEKLRILSEEGKAPQGILLETLDAIDAVRQIGNIGAHMEADINTIVDVDPDEAQALIELLELLFQDWYIARHARKARLNRLVTIAADKKHRTDPIPGVA
jgi:hypothetical protein